MAGTAAADNGGGNARCPGVQMEVRSAIRFWFGRAASKSPPEDSLMRWQSGDRLRRRQSRRHCRAQGGFSRSIPVRAAFDAAGPQGHAGGDARNGYPATWPGRVWIPGPNGRWG